MAPLNPNAPCFVPRSSSGQTYEVTGTARSEYTPYDANDDQFADDFEGGLTAEELEELEAAEEWVNTMAWMEELERDHLIELALTHAPKWKLDLIHSRVGLAKPIAALVKPMNRKGAATGKGRAGFW